MTTIVTESETFLITPTPGYKRRVGAPPNNNGNYNNINCHEKYKNT
jgi:hypothetical protein